jgi:peptidoglycan/xylan/chitin deacetylase (PgdA/CDA1 family)
MRRRLFPVLFSGGAAPVYTTIPQYQVTSNTLIEGFEDYTSWTKVTGVDPIDDATNFVQGSHSVRITNVGAQSSMDKELSFTMATGERLVLDVYIYSGTTQRFTVLCSNNAGFTKYMYCTITLGTPIIGAYWAHLDLGEGDFTMDGGMTWTTAITKVRIRSEGTNTDASLDNLCKQVNTFSAAAIFSFDNTYPSIYSIGLPMFNARSVRATMYVTTNELDTDGFMTTPQLLEMYAAGWTIGNHTKDHVNFTGLSQAQIEASVGGCITDLQGIGITGNGPYHFCYPGGIYTAVSDAALTAQNILSARTTGGSPTYQGLWGYNEPWLHLSAQNLGNNVSLATAKAKVDAAKARNKVAHFYSHVLATTTSDTLTWATADMAALLDYCIAQNVPIITVDDYYRLYSQDVTIRWG